MYMDKVFRTILFASAFLSLLLVAGILLSLVIESVPALKHIGLFEFISSSKWDSHYEQEHYGTLSFLIATFVTSIIAMLISFPFSMSLTILNGGYFAETKFAYILNLIINFFANIPSILWGILGYFSLRPILISLDIGVQGLGIITASIVLAIMITPITTSLCLDLINKVPFNIKEAAYSLGASPFEVISKICLPYLKKEIVATYLFAFGRILGETMIIVMLIGNNNHLPTSIADTSNTMSSIILFQFGSASDLKFSSLFAISLLLFIITTIINSIVINMLKGRKYGS
ncbi:phosphate transport system permease protein [Dysgonomonadaceae bacterium PH5-43]|nr:phosphate transport system permease protein [Dysgonomonadaceae bacterium PH5-43]